MLNRVRSLVAVLVLGLPSLATADRALPESPPVKVKVEDPTSTFLKQEKYTYCDVKILADYWKTSAKEAKATVGTKLQAHAEASLETVLGDARGKTKLKCTYVDGGFTMKDVKKLSQLWHLSIAEAKSTIELKLSHGTSIYLKEEIRGSENNVDSAYDAFHNQTKYTYCDAHMIGTLWGKSASEGKKAIGAKLVAKNTKGLVKLIADARKNAKAHVEARCSYDTAELMYDDLAILASLWKKPQDQMKALVAEKLALGQEATIKAQLKKEKARLAKLAPKPTPAPTPPPTTTPDKATPVKSVPAVAVPPATKQATPPAPTPAPAPTKSATPPAPTPGPTPTKPG